MRPCACASNKGSRVWLRSAWTSAVMKTVLPARARPVTPRRKLGVERPDAKSLRPPAAMRVLSKREVRFNASWPRFRAIVGVNPASTQELSSWFPYQVTRAREDGEGAFAILDGVPVIAVEGDHGERAGRIFLGEALAQFRIALADEALRQPFNGGIVADDHDRFCRFGL